MRRLSYRTNYLNSTELVWDLKKNIILHSVFFGCLFCMDMVALVQGPRQVLPLRDRGQQDFFH
jgi:hypothetical protein